MVNRIKSGRRPFGSFQKIKICPVKYPDYSPEALILNHGNLQICILIWISCLNTFGVERLMFASDWPFILLAGMYVQWKSLLEKFMEKFSPEDRDKFFGENANRFYRI